MKVVAIIPARAGSERLPKKNRLELAGLPLINWSINFAKKIKFVDDIIVSTNDSVIVKKNKRDKFIKIFKRSKSLSGKNVKTLDVIFDTVNRYENHFDKIETILLLQVTSPFRSIKKLYYAYRKYKKYNKKKSIISVTRSKKKNFFYKPNGNFYIASKVFLKKYRSFNLKKKTYHIILKQGYLSVDIDTKNDFIKAKSYLENNSLKKKFINFNV